MLKKKLKVTEAPSKLSKLKKLTKQVPPDDEEDDVQEIDDEGEEVDEDEDEEETPRSKAITSKLKKKARVEEVDDDEDEVDEEEEERPKRKAGVLGTKAKSAKSALSKAFASVPMTNNADDIPSGVYEAILRAAVLQDPDARGQSARFNFDLCSPDYAEKNNVATWRKLVDEDGEPVGGGIRTLYQDIAKLGYEKPDDEDELQEIFEDINKTKPGVSIKITYRKWEGNDYQTVAIIGECDNEVVQEYRDNIPY